VRTVLKYSVIIEKAGGNYSAYCPDLPGCAATGPSAERALANIKKAIGFHIEGLKKEGLPVPRPSSKVEYIEVAVSL